MAVLLIIGCASNPSGTPPKAPPHAGTPQIDLTPDNLITNRVREMMCASAKLNAILSNWVTNPRTLKKAKYLTGCMDPNDNDPRKKETTFLYAAKTADFNLNQNPVKPPMGEGMCKSESDFCVSNGTRDNTLMQTACKKNPVTNVWSIEKIAFDCETLNSKAGKYTCHEGACVNVNSLVVDLSVKNLIAKSENCNTYFKFDICNNGGQDVQSDFKIWVTVNGSKVEITYPAGQNKIRAGQCVSITEPQKFSIIAFGLGLNQNANVTVEANPEPRQIAELNTINNKMTNPALNTGAEWMLNASVKCDTFCYETDYVSTLSILGKNYKKLGSLYSTNQGFATQRTDHCTGHESATIWEYYCKTPTIVNGIATDLVGIDIIKCTDAFAQQGVPGVCKDGACVEADRYNHCSDTEAGKTTTANGTVTYSTPMPAGPNGYDPNQSFPLLTVRDTCISPTHVREQYCGSSADYQNIRLSAVESCDKPETPGFVCDSNQGICVPGGSCSCVMKDASGATVLTNLLDRTETTTRTCNGSIIRQETDKCFLAGSDTLFQYSCDANGNFVTNSVYCSNQGPNWGCHEGACVPPNPALLACVDSDTQGVPNYTQAGTIKQTDLYGNQRADLTEDCDVNGTHVNEWYCGADKTAKAIHYDCRNLGSNYVCSNGACVPQ